MNSNVTINDALLFIGGMFFIAAIFACAVWRVNRNETKSKKESHVPRR